MLCGNDVKVMIVSASRAVVGGEKDERKCVFCCTILCLKILEWLPYKTRTYYTQYLS